jgi:HIRAN domain
MSKLFLAWQDPKSRNWFPIGCLELNDEKYTFCYISGVKKAMSESGFQPLYSFPELEKVYVSKTLFPLFANRLMPSSRPDYQNYIQWLSIEREASDDMSILVRSGGRKATDDFEIFSCPEPDEAGIYQMYFFVHGLRYVPKSSIEEVDHLQKGDCLYLAQDFQNPYHPQALLIRTKAKHILGYCPKYLVTDISEILHRNPQLVKVQVQQVNPLPTPLQFRLLCKISAQWQQDFTPFNSPDYQSIMDSSLILA